MHIPELSPIELLPPWPRYIPVIDLFLFLVYWAIYQVFLTPPEERESKELARTS